ncbi:hypothetical protein KUTeg_020205 [Tegillarca granosa]|uniref:Uncharacterized protein n=1 Tax=Tegillarca granosa TaxID=220873 RepID=A0ABQ9E757_TEGGR|nr:hypothetical protein KUTeg_020205 [Tegillarca granosa]
MMGVIFYNGDKFIVEPLAEGDESNSNNTNKIKAHYMYRHTTKQNNDDGVDGDQSHCVVKGNYKHTRRKNKEDISFSSSSSSFSSETDSISSLPHSDIKKYSVQNTFNISIEVIIYQKLIIVTIIIIIMINIVYINVQPR